MEQTTKVEENDEYEEEEEIRNGKSTKVKIKRKSASFVGTLRNHFHWKSKSQEWNSESPEGAQDGKDPWTKDHSDLAVLNIEPKIRVSKSKSSVLSRRSDANLISQKESGEDAQNIFNNPLRIASKALNEHHTSPSLSGKKDPAPHSSTISPRNKSARPSGSAPNTPSNSKGRNNQDPLEMYIPF